MCVMTSLGILGPLGWGAYSVGKSAWKHRSTISNFVADVYDSPDRLNKVAMSNQRRT